MDQVEGEAKITLVGVGELAIVPSTAHRGHVAPQLGEHLEGVADNVLVTFGHFLHSVLAAKAA